MSEPKLTFAELQAEAARLIAKGEMPSLAELLSAVAKVREKYGPRILTARMKANEEAAKRKAYIHGLVLAARQIQIEESQLSLFPKEKTEK